MDRRRITVKQLCDILTEYDDPTVVEFYDCAEEMWIKEVDVVEVDGIVKLVKLELETFSCLR